MEKERRRRESDDVSIGAAMAHAHQERDSARKDARKASGEASGIPDGEFPIHDCRSQGGLAGQGPMNQREMGPKKGERKHLVKPVT